MGLLDVLSKPFEAIADVGKEIVDGAADIVTTVADAGGEVLDAVKDIPVVGGAISTFLHANPITGPAVTAFSAARAGVNLLRGEGDLGSAVPILGAALDAVGVPSGVVDSIAGAAGVVDAISDGNVGEAVVRGAGALGAPIPEEVGQVLQGEISGAEALLRFAPEEFRQELQVPSVEELLHALQDQVSQLLLRPHDLGA